VGDQLYSERPGRWWWCFADSLNGDLDQLSGERGPRFPDDERWGREVIGFLFALIFAAGVGLVWFGTVADVRLSRPAAPVRIAALLAGGGLDISAYAFMAAVAGCGLALGLVAWLIVGVPAVTIAAVIAGACAPVAWARSRRQRRVLERERAWPAVLAQLADALEAGLAWPAAVALVAESGPVALRREWAAFTARLRGSDLNAALEGLRAAGERTADSVVLLLRAALVDVPTGGLAPVLRELSQVLSERLEAREKARSRASTMHVEAAILALSPIVILLLIGAASPGYLNAYRSVGGTIVALIGGGLIFGCYLLMRKLGRVPEPRRTTGGRS
jgi:tight adherence protein B